MHHKLAFADLKDSEYPMDYAVPNFGVDRDIQATQDHIGGAELRLGHRLAFADLKDSEYPMDYAVPNFGVDRDIAAT